MTINKLLRGIIAPIDFLVRTLRILIHSEICLADVLRVYAVLYAHKTLVICGNRTVSYAEMWSHTALFAQKLQSYFFSDVVAGKPVSVSLLSPNCVGVVQLQLASLESGVPYVPLNPLYNANELAVALNDAQSELIFVHESLCPLYEEAKKLGYIKQNVKSIYFATADNLNDIFAVPIGRTRGFRKSDVGQVLFTSGTTSKPKGCASFRLFSKPPRKQASLLPAGPLNMFLVTNVCGSIFYPMMRLTIASKGQVEFVDPDALVKRDPFQQMFDSWRRGGKTLQLLFGDQLYWVLQQYRQKPESFVGLHLANIFYGGMKFPVSAIERLMEIFPKANYTQFYGSTEGGIFSVLTPEDHRANGDSAFRRGSAGKIPPMSDIRIIGLKGEGDISRRPGIPGELQVGSSLSMRGYWLNPKATEEEFVEDENGKRWFCVGDVVEVDTQGYLYVRDRVKDMIVLDTARNVFCSEIEDVLSQQASINAVCCFGLENASGIGELIAIAVVPVSPVCGAEEQGFIEQIRAFCLDKLPNYKVPEKIFLVDSIPRSKGGKVLRRALREQYSV